MLGLADFLKAARGSAALALRRAHPLTGPALMVVLWVTAMGSFLWIARDDGEPARQASPRGQSENDTAEVLDSEERTATTPPDAGDGTDPVVPDPAATTGGVPLDGSDPTEPDEVLESSARSPVPASPPSTEATRPSRAEPAGPTGPTTTTTRAQTTTPTTARPPATTTTTAPPPAEGGGGLLGGLLDLLGL